jgi:hypothetical protein
MKANQMPPVETFFGWHGCKKAPPSGAFSGMEAKVVRVLS